MTEIRRYYSQGHAVFLTLVCRERSGLLSEDSSKQLVLTILRELRAETAFRMHAWAILDNHLHLLITPGLSDASVLMQKMKLRFTRRQGRPERIWQRRFWDRICRNRNEFDAFRDYIHYNPVKHGICAAPGDYEWSSFSHYQKQGYYAPGWGQGGHPRSIGGMEQE